MKNSQIELLVSLTKELQSTKRSRVQIVESLKSSKIIDKNENFTIHYPSLKKYSESQK